MGVDVVLKRVNQRGTSRKKRRLDNVDFVQDADDVFADLCDNSALPMLNRVDRYRSQILTSADMAQFISELNATRDLVAGERERERDILNAVLRLAELCAEGTTLELHLVGD
ncbi:hypothetical protein LRD69_07940 [Streptomyces sp. JH14]|uniref:hypothetical protein n=1 Tax=Streptomyces sp. JH14 TaxID=2793630 RepID=UPI0023F6C9FB|nr:hypothetical protein [Streptomyces sp. JH14]MDF6042097.1 hypothetical protein [Streptomyces sp. JH14]